MPPVQSTKTHEVHLRNVCPEDARLLFEWRNLPQTVALSSLRKSVAWDEHQTWFTKALGSPERTRIYVIRLSQDDVGVVRFDRKTETRARISAYLHPSRIGTGIGTVAIALAVEVIARCWTALEYIEALILSTNTRGIRSFEKAGFARNEESPDSGHDLAVFKLSTLEPSIADQAIWQSEAETTRTLYENKFDEHGPSPDAVGWGSRESQARRFEILAEISDLRTANVLDYGCGLGDMYEWLCRHEFAGRYTGIDMTRPMIEQAGKKHPNATFICGGLEQLKSSERFDYVLASGILTYIQHAPYRHVFHIARSMLERARMGAAFNSLSTWGNAPVAGECQLDPARCLAAVKEIGSNLVLRHDYLPHDFTIYIRRKE